MEIALFWIGLSVLAGVAAHSRGRSFLGFFLLSLLLSPVLGLLAALLVAKGQAELDARAVRAGELRRCPHCAELVRSDANVCKHCGRDLPHTA